MRRVYGIACACGCCLLFTAAGYAKVNRAYTLSHKNYSILQEAAPVIKSLQEYITNEYNSAGGVCSAARERRR